MSEILGGDTHKYHSLQQGEGWEFLRKCEDPIEVFETLVRHTITNPEETLKAMAGAIRGGTVTIQSESEYGDLCTTKVTIEQISRGESPFNEGQLLVQAVGVIIEPEDTNADPILFVDFILEKRQEGEGEGERDEYIATYGSFIKLIKIPDDPKPPAANH